MESAVATVTPNTVAETTTTVASPTITARTFARFITHLSFGSPDVGEPQRDYALSRSEVIVALTITDNQAAPDAA